MSGDVQPRKRKDKKRRKDEGEQIPVQTHPPPPSPISSDDINIHVHKEDGTGGGICAKLVFFRAAFRARVDTVDTESRFSQIFEGWIDSGPDHHDDHNVEETLDDHDLDHEDDDEHNLSEQDEEEEEDEDEEEDEEEHEPDEDDENNEIDDEDEEDEEESLDDEEVQASEEDEVESEEKDEEEDEDEQELDEDEDEEDHEEDEQELENIGSEEDKEDDEQDDDVSTDKNEEEEEDDEDDDDEQVPVTATKTEPSDVGDDDAPAEEVQQESSGTPDDKPKPVKVDADEPAPDLKRRNTIVVPPTYQEVEADIEPEEEDYSEEEEEELSEEETHEPKSAKTRYQELRSTYTRSLTPEGEIDYHRPPEPYDDEYEDEEAASEEEEEEDDEERGEGESEEDEDYDEDEDEELLKRLEAKYGKLREGATERQADIENSDSEKSEDGDGYEFSNITNKDDYKIKSAVDEAQKSVEKNSAYAIKLFDKILQKHPSSPRSLYGKALSLDYLADQRRSNDILQQALTYYTQLLNVQDVPNALFEMAAERSINRMRFVGQYRNAINVHKVEEARSVLKQILVKWPNDGFALVHYGFILKTTDNKLEEAIEYLQKGLETRAEGVVDGRFYFHLGDALARLGRNDDAMKVYEDGVKDKVFLSRYQRSLYNVPRLTGKPWWNLSDLPYLDLFRLLKQNWEKIRDEGLAVLNERGYFQDESENLKDTGDWKQFELFARGQKNAKNCKACPFTCSIVERISEARNCKRGQTKFSVMHPGTHVWPHCGPTNCRLRVHLGLRVPSKTFIRVADETRSWKEGEMFVFDDSFEHEVWHNGTELRLVLIVDVWHPELTAAEKRGLSPI
ncbi:hypothetical protein NQ315_010359 [Exocentrus adspersus]|uniref:Aspartyl/asparaginy/proline hydroxylase domain-containing protein n=1 Tax=Exocentrus adspersus TaxID=1586481 RepID=A0AAV8WB05_9CUCU|nr:hypothetical protein NQ315_010359 [Exocentrus adspersus]